MKIVIALLLVESALSAITNHPGNIKDCLADVYFVLDSSASAGPVRFHNIRRFVSKLAMELWHSKYYATKVGTIRYGGSQTAEITLPLTSIVQRKDIVRGLARTFYTGGHSARLDSAFGTYREEGQHFSRGNRDLIRDVLFIITDNPANVSEPVIAAAQSLKDNGVGIIVLSISGKKPSKTPRLKSWNRMRPWIRYRSNSKFEKERRSWLALTKNRNKASELEKLASTPQFYWQLDDMEKLSAFIDTAVLQICQLANDEDKIDSTYVPSFQTWQHSYGQMVELSGFERMRKVVKTKKKVKSLKGWLRQKEREAVQKFTQKEDNGHSSKVMLLIPSQPRQRKNKRYFSVYENPRTEETKYISKIKVSATPSGDKQNAFGYGIFNRGNASKQRLEPKKEISSVGTDLNGKSDFPSKASTRNLFIEPIDEFVRFVDRSPESILDEGNLTSEVVGESPGYSEALEAGKIMTAPKIAQPNVTLLDDIKKPLVIFLSRFDTVIEKFHEFDNTRKRH